MRDLQCGGMFSGTASGEFLGKARCALRHLVGDLLGFFGGVLSRDPFRSQAHSGTICGLLCRELGGHLKGSQSMGRRLLRLMGNRLKERFALDQRGNGREIGRSGFRLSLRGWGGSLGRL
jgi:hypothetical protein